MEQLSHKALQVKAKGWNISQAGGETKVRQRCFKYLMDLYDEDDQPPPEVGEVRAAPVHVPGGKVQTIYSKTPKKENTFAGA